MIGELPFNNAGERLRLVAPRIPNADHAEITAEVTATLSLWTAAPLVDATASSLTFLIPRRSSRP